MKSNHESTVQTPQDLLNDLRALVAEAEKLMNDAVSGNSDEAIGALRSRFNTAQERLAGFYNGARTKVVSGARVTDEAIRSNPYQAMAIALGAGLLVGVLLGRRGN